MTRYSVAKLTATYAAALGLPNLNYEQGLNKLAIKVTSDLRKASTFSRKLALKRIIWSATVTCSIIISGTIERRDDSLKAAEANYIVEYT